MENKVAIDTKNGGVISTTMVDFINIISNTIFFATEPPCYPIIT